MLPAVPYPCTVYPHLLFLVSSHGLLSSASKSSLICLTAQGTLARCPCCSWNGFPPNLNPILLMSDPWTVFTTSPTSTMMKGLLSPMMVDLVLLCTRPDCSAVGLATAVRMLLSLRIRGCEWWRLLWAGICSTGN